MRFQIRFLVAFHMTARPSLARHGKTRWILTKKALSALPVFPLHFFIPFERDWPFFFCSGLLFLPYCTTERSDILSFSGIHFHQTALRKKIHEWEPEAPELRRAPRAIQGISSGSTEPRPPMSNSRTSAIQSSFLSIAPFYLSRDHFHMINLFNRKNTYIQCMLIHNKKNRIFLLHDVHSVSGIYDYQSCNSLFSETGMYSFEWMQIRTIDSFDPFNSLARQISFLDKVERKKYTQGEFWNNCVKLKLILEWSLSANYGIFVPLNVRRIKSV